LPAEAGGAKAGARREDIFSARTAIAAVHVRGQAGRRNSPSLRLPVR
jgi:hypothetical protein